MNGPVSGSRVAFPYETLRNISSPQDVARGRKILAGHAPFRSILGLPTNENVRDYLVEAEGKKRRQPTQVHRAMRETLENSPDDFSVLNGGVVIVTTGHDVDDKKRVMMLEEPSIINGSQTQGVLKDYVVAKEKNEAEVPEIYVTFELIVTDDDQLVAETSIARNFQNDVMSVSIAGRLGQLDELEEALRRAYPDAKLRKSETTWTTRLSLTEDHIFTEKLIQVMTALAPEELWLKASEAGNPNKVYTYSYKEKCLKEFQDVFKRAKDPSDPEHVRNRDLYQFYLDIAPQALELYDTWKTHQGFRGTAIRAIERDGRKIKEVPDGIVFPILAALAVFATKTPKGWRIRPPDGFQDEELIRSAKSVYQDLASSNPTLMGKSRACYSALHQITSIYRRLLTPVGS